jgi:YVTN family beta-propeller protein
MSLGKEEVTRSEGNLSPLYYGQLLVHGMGFSPDHHTIVVVSIGSNSVAFIDTATNAIKHITYVGRSPHEAFFTPDGKLLGLSPSIHTCSRSHSIPMAAEP